MPNNGEDILAAAIGRNSAIVLSLPSAGMLRHHKSRFLADDVDGFWIESASNDRMLIDDLIARNTPVGISFKSGTNKVSFVVPIIKREQQYQVNADTVLEALQLALPADIRAIQRRNNYRVRVPEDSDLVARIWRIPEHFFITDKPVSHLELIAKLRDISIGGMGVFLHNKGEEPPKVLAGERLRVALRYRELDELILEGRVRYLPPAGTDAPIRTGIQFKKLENDLEGRQNLAALTRIVGELQREEVRRTRLGIKVA
jgi:c-di-GMP-binding flagellar brake protein YcgR